MSTTKAQKSNSDNKTLQLAIETTQNRTSSQPTTQNFQYQSHPGVVYDISRL